jgi:cytochrome c biogenesis protein
MTKEKNAVWRLLASVKLALVTLFILSAASIIGTVIKQKQPPGFYVDEYGEALAGLFEAFSLNDMYASWWFIALMALFAVNLVVCSIERLPGVWRLVRLDNLATDPGQLEKMGITHRAVVPLAVEAASVRLREHLAGSGWGSPARRDRDGAVLLFTQKGHWSRLGVYVVHLSILVIIAGAVIGKTLGYKAYVFLPEGRATTHVFLQGSAERVPLGFELHSDSFQRSYYPNGMIREYRTDLTVVDSQRTDPLHKSIVINDPLNHRGITFYHGDPYPLEEYFVTIREEATGREHAFRVPAQRDIPWQGTGVSFRVEELRAEEDGTVRQARIHFSDGRGEPSLFWMNDRGTETIARTDGNYTFSFRQLYSTLLLVNKDPGVWVVWIGCILMLIGLGMSFGFAHRRLWVLIAPQKQGAQILVSGTSNKQRPAFERRFRELVERLEGDATLSVRDKKGKSKT